MADCNNCATSTTCTKDKEACQVVVNQFSKIDRIIGVMSGKGGVGKSTVAVAIAKRLQRQGYKVGILDADVTGPSVPRLLGLHEQRAKHVEEYILPVETMEGIRAMSLNFLVDEENSPVIWRGPIVSNMVKQFYTDVFWGNLDYLVVDMPPGTSDVALTVMQSLPLHGLVMVTLPQDMVSMIVEKAVQMARKMSVPVLGVIENMSYIVCPDCGKKINLFGDGNSDNLLYRHQLHLLGEIPMTQGMASMASAAGTDAEMDALFAPIVENIRKVLG
ncbi:Mrp/NBP35 family ATP-binding protein [Anaerotalea alkaliphila]|uniref:Iron-sulfur cluster carrier protein n=1 Tax=Anaerotalea alkaliphila TaxID=2662126 RepID=A0A7X5KL93_9FIRM|nr:Mrp/NBP35 family ATP-binding protein [Anaerotalea alkaliphila]NDL66586.1 Mrp/NBP35 family ATP-binding protein [Anaerotalea alkaliphila]